MKKAISLLLLICICVSLCACGADADKAGNNETDSRLLTDVTATEEDISHLESMYTGRIAYHGELHDHSDSGGTSDGRQTLDTWSVYMDSLNIDYAAILDHKQVLHMRLPAWSSNVFVGGTEAATTITDRQEEYNRFHYNMIFATPEQLESVLQAFPEFNYSLKENGEYHFGYPKFTSARFNELITAVKEAGGFFVIPHPSATEDQYTEDALAYWFQDETGFEVFYGNNFASTKNWITEANYLLWTKLLAEGKRIWATSGNDDHELPEIICLSTVYSEEDTAQSHISHLRVGDFTAGPVGIRMCVGDTAMGGQGSFENQRLVFSISDFHEYIGNSNYKYRVDLYDDQGVIYSQEISYGETLYFATDADPDARFYRVEIYDITQQMLLALGNPIWNE